MNESETSEPKTRRPAQQAHQPQPVQAPNDLSQAPHNAHAMTGKLRKDKNEDEAPSRPGNEEGRKDCGPEAAVDDARFTAGVVKLYEALLKEPIPEEMLRLVEKIGKQERK